MGPFLSNDRATPVSRLPSLAASCAREIESYVTKLNETHSPLHISIEEILELQFNSNTFGEVGGRAVRSDTGLTLELIQPGLEIYAYNQLTKFKETGNSESAKYLAFEIETYLRHCGRAMSLSILEAMREAHDFLEIAGRGQRLQPVEKHIAIASATVVLASSYRISKEEINQSDPNFLGVFHVHRRGDPPNEIDIVNHALLGIAGLIISPEPYGSRWRRLRIFLVADGGAREIWNSQ